MAINFINRDMLKDYEGRRVEVDGFYDKMNVLSDYSKFRNNKTVLMQDCTVFVDDKEISIGHVWVQWANALANLKAVRGDKIKFNARVARYLKRLDAPNEEKMMTEYRFGLTHPDYADFVGERVVTTTTTYIPVGTPDPRPVAQLSDVFGLLPEVKQLAQKVGKDNVEAVLPHLGDLVALSEKAGGAERLAKLLEFLV